MDRESKIDDLLLNMSDKYTYIVKMLTMPKTYTEKKSLTRFF